MKKTYMFEVSIIDERDDPSGDTREFHLRYFTNALLSKNNGALVTFRDQFDKTHSIDPRSISIDMNVDRYIHCALPAIDLSSL